MHGVWINQGAICVWANMHAHRGSRHAVVAAWRRAAAGGLALYAVCVCVFCWRCRPETRGGNWG